MTARNVANLAAATARKRQDAIVRAERALAELTATEERVTFRSVARAAGCSPDFLYRTPALAVRIRELRAQPPTAAVESTEPVEAVPSPTVRALAAQITALKRRHREELAELRAALAAAHGESLQLRRQLGARTTPTGQTTEDAPDAAPDLAR